MIGAGYWVVIQIIRNRHIEIDQALLTKLHDGGRGHRLADGRPVIDSVWRGRDTSGAVRQAKLFLVDNIFSQRDRDRQSRRSGPDKAVRQPESGQGAGDSGAVKELAFNAIHTAVPISNAFAIELELSSWKDRGGFEVGPYQGAAKTSGYRLAYSPGARLELLRATDHGSNVIDTSAKPLPFEDQKVHRIEWTRRADGGMTVSVDDKEIFNLFDRSFKDPFDGLMVVNRGGDIILKHIAVFGVDSP